MTYLFSEQETREALTAIRMATQRATESGNPQAITKDLRVVTFNTAVQRFPLQIVEVINVPSEKVLRDS